jgi:violaxanthin de-epoxidase
LSTWTASVESRTAASVASFLRCKSIDSALATVLAGCSLAAATATTGSVLFTPAPVQAADGAAIGKCLFQSCQLPLAKCVTNPNCLANLVCIQTCNGRADESACQIHCGDIFDNEVIGEFNKCAVTQKACVPRTVTSDYPVPPAGSVASKFDVKAFDGRWYISAGLNQIFDTFPCQVHFFDSPGPGELVGDLSWRVVEPDGEFVTKKAIQTFKQDAKEPGILYNHENEYLHYEDDWYILDWDTSTPGDEFILVYYRGRNDAWDGYGGAVLYTRADTAPSAIIPRVRTAAEKAGLDWTKFLLTDNSCKASPDAKAVLRMREQFAKKELLLGEEALAAQLTNERSIIGGALSNEGSTVLKALGRIESKVEAFEKELEKDAVAIEKELEGDVTAIGKAMVREEKVLFGAKK